MSSAGNEMEKEFDEIAYDMEPDSAPTEGREQQKSSYKPVDYTLFNQKSSFDFLKAHLRSAADILRGSLDPADYRQPIMTLLFIKRLNDTFIKRLTESHLVIKLPFESNFCILLLSVSATYTFPKLSMVISRGLLNCPPAEPSEPYFVMK
jgi:HsdM N-terminal domain